MRYNINEVNRECKICAFHTNSDFAKTELKPIITRFPFQKLGIDVAGPLPTSIDGFRYVLCIMDYFSKFCVLIPLKEINAEAIRYEFFQDGFQFLAVHMSYTPTMLHILLVL